MSSKQIDFRDPIPNPGSKVACFVSLLLNQIVDPFSAYVNAGDYNLSEEEADLIKTFLQTFEETRPDEFGAALEVRSVIETNDIFTPDGYRCALEQIVKMWDLEDFVEYKRVDSNRHGIRS